MTPLFKLILLQFNGFFRRALRGASGAKRVVFFTVGAVLLVCWLVAVVASAMGSGHSKPEEVRLVMPLALLGVCLITIITSAGDKAIAFTPGEVDQLFPGPFTRRQLLVYKLLKSALASVLTGLILSAALLKHAQRWPACFVGVFLALMFVQFFSIAAVLVGQTLGAAAYSKARKIVLGLVIVGAVVAGRMWMGLGSNGAGVKEIALQFHASRVGRAILAPLQPFGEAITATSAGQLFKSATYAIFLIAAMFGIILVLDANYLEAAMVASERRYAKIQKMRRGSLLTGVGASKQASWRVPQFPWARGAGPIAWRQATNALRSSRGLILLLLIVAIAAAPLLLSGASGKKVLAPAIGIIVWLTFFTSSMLNFDFRGDVDQMDTLKALPISAIAMALGQLVTPVLVMSGLHVVMLACLARVTGYSPRNLALIALMIVPFNALLFCAENLVFLLFPTRPAAASPGDLQILGRKFVFLLFKSAIILICAAIAGALATVAGVISGGSIPLIGGIIWTTVAAECIGLLFGIAWAYQKFDPSVDTPA
ncbi:MAG TPA: putative ABC exporter domain-containing protein [Humisphaera sp.]|jgi:hypothetical protein|nr:putative ABC exporter domain-containing protein [Humisphaera sp.]